MVFVLFSLDKIYKILHIENLKKIFFRLKIIDDKPLHILWGCPRGVMVKAMDCRIVEREFVLQSRYYVHFRANTLGKGMDPLFLPATD